MSWWFLLKPINMSVMSEVWPTVLQSEEVLFSVLKRYLTQILFVCCLKCFTELRQLLRLLIRADHTDWSLMCWSCWSEKPFSLSWNHCCLSVCVCDWQRKSYVSVWSCDLCVSLKSFLWSWLWFCNRHKLVWFKPFILLKCSWARRKIPWPLTALSFCFGVYFTNNYSVNWSAYYVSWRFINSNKLWKNYTFLNKVTKCFTENGEKPKKQYKDYKTSWV